jgi:hypothetical protein
MITHVPEKSLDRDQILVAISESGLIASGHVSHPFARMVDLPIS